MCWIQNLDILIILIGFYRGFTAKNKQRRINIIVWRRIRNRAKFTDFQATKNFESIHSANKCNLRSLCYDDIGIQGTEALYFHDLYASQVVVGFLLLKKTELYNNILAY